MYLFFLASLYSAIVGLGMKEDQKTDLVTCSIGVLASGNSKQGWGHREKGSVRKVLGSGPQLL